jgi:hypothetical protein
VDRDHIHVSTSQLMDAVDVKEPAAFFKAYHSISQVLGMLFESDFKDEQRKNVTEKSLIMKNSVSMKVNAATDSSSTLCTFLSEIFVAGFAAINSLTKEEVCRKSYLYRIQQTHFGPEITRNSYDGENEADHQS